MKIRFFLLSYFVLISFIAARSQAFEGKIKYENTYTSKLPGVSNEQFQGMMGPLTVYTIQGGNYKSEMNGQMLSWQLYVNKDNKIYTKIAGQPSIFWNDAAENKDEVKNVTLNKGVMDVLGYMCDELVLETTSGTQKFYFSEKLKLDATMFDKHKFGNFSLYASKANSLPLKMIAETPQVTITSTAVEVTPAKVDAAFFDLPAGATLAKSPY